MTKRLVQALGNLNYEIVEDFSDTNTTVFINNIDPAVSLEFDLNNKEVYKFRLDDNLDMFKRVPFTQEEINILVANKYQPRI